MSPRIRNIVLGSAAVVVVLAIVVWWYSGFSLDFMHFFAAELTPTPTTTPLATEVSCVPATQTVKVGASATLTATGGTGTYAWIAPEGSPAEQSTGAGQFTVAYTKVGTKKVLVESAGDIVACTVIVTK